MDDKPPTQVDARDMSQNAVLGQLPCTRLSGTGAFISYV
jgi:hypothetical protein